jgi:hypothetical protein
LFVDGPSLWALDIFKEEEHPSAMGIGTSKEGVSVYSLLQRCVTGMVRPPKLFKQHKQWHACSAGNRARLLSNSIQLRGGALAGF